MFHVKHFFIKITMEIVSRETFEKIEIKNTLSICYGYEIK